ncbi:uncharacterized protein N7473_012934 [Penicillium subrubescens]|uniref:Uncharacterized protein n=1 Tax=Penicillium subrubescens TaxID=1316194 RepID=A0A1Q5T6P2_9EURO|nr:uncharacterized protein N7473_012934 [Penicillium subrubescens]KAJ5875587.1 hypothetical protein N7473_012934 [Penicillium subrubescens]OKO95892.1 hypothetical protein PENSUB_10913 [Penicillium subrubescens]
MPTPLQPPDHPLALRRTHLLAPAPDRLTNTPTTLTITRNNTLSGRAFSVHHLRTHEPYDSPTRRSLLYTVSGRFWSGTQAREIRDAAGRPLLELRRMWWQRAWSVKRAGGGGDELMGAEMRWGAGVKMKMAVRVRNALLVGAGRRSEADDEFLRSEYYPMHSGRGGRRQQHQNHHQQYRRWASPPPPYTAIASSSTNPGPGPGPGSIRRRRSTDTVSSKSTHLPSYASAHRRSTHSLRELLDAVEPPAEPAPASSYAYAFPPPRRYSEAVVEERAELRVVQMSNTVAAVMMGEKKIVSIRREKVMMNSQLSGPMDRWEVGVAEGVDLLLAVSIVLIMAEFVRHEYRVRIS